MDHSGRNVDNGTVHGGGGGKWEISVTAAQFCCKPKTALKK